ncbi:MMPL family transporter [Nocardioides sp.]|uniref:MMPL family transporter n=1 Tax=Nocardioides sp. TaxID=35761 RepID=UPI003564124E
MTRAIHLITARGTAWVVALLPLLFAVLITVSIGEAERDPQGTDNLPSGLDSTQGTVLRDRLPAEQGTSAVVLWTTESGTFSDQEREELERQAQDLGAIETRTGALTLADDQSAAIAVVAIDTEDPEGVADLVDELREDLRAAAPGGVLTQVTGPAAVQADLSAVFDGANTRLLAATALVVAILLIITYRSPVLWLVPLTVIGIADRFAAVLATQSLGALGVAWDASTIGILSVLVFGAGTDYSLLLISRYRDELKVHASRHAAMAVAVRRTGEAILASATTVVLGLLTLLLSLVPTTRGLGLACAIGVVVAAGAAIVVLPAALVLMGRWVFWPRVPHVGDPALVDTNSLWRRVGNRVAQRPVNFVAGALLLLAIMSVGLFRLDQGLSQSDQFLEKPEAISAAERLSESFPAGLTDPTQVLTRADADAVLEVVQGTAGVSNANISVQADGITRIDAILDADPGTRQAEQTTLTLRERLESFDDTHVTGTEAAAIDKATGAARDRKVILPLILVLVLAALLLLLRAIVAPLILVATVLATYAASLGFSWWVFTGLLGFEALDSSVPLLSFLFLVALGVDYNIFLVTRARQEAARYGSRRGMLRGLSATGGVITSAGILLAAVFFVLGVLPLVVLAQLGAVVCIGVLLDTLLVRTVLVPALALMLGDRFWWPRRIPAPAEPAEAPGPPTSVPTATP